MKHFIKYFGIFLVTMTVTYGLGMLLQKPTQAHKEDQACYVYNIKVVDVAGHYKCDQGWTLYNTDNCKKWTGNHWQYKDADWVATTYKCPQDYSSFGDKCRKEVACVTPTPVPPTPTPEPEITPTPTPEIPFVDTTHGNGGDPGPAPMCSGPAPVVQPRNFGCTRNGGMVHCAWVPGDESIADIFYSEGKVTTPPLTWPHALVVDYSQYAVHGQADIFDLVVGRDYTFALRSRNACSGGEFLYEVVVDKDGKGIYFPMTYWYLSK